MAFCFALKLMLPISEDMLEKTGHKLTNIHQHQVYKLLRTTSYYKTLVEKNAILQAVQMKTL